MSEHSSDQYRDLFPRDYGSYKKESYKSHVETLEEACGWLGITKGRASKYAKLIREFYEDNKRTEEHILAYNESSEIVDIYRLWIEEIDNFPSLKEKIAQALNSGSVLVERERTENSGNWPRNYSFVYFVAGTLLKARMEVVAVDGVLASGSRHPTAADITILCAGTFIDIECKRPQSTAAFGRRVQEARGQINKRRDQLGIIAVDCSLLVRPRGKLLEVGSPQEGNALISGRLQRIGTAPRIIALFQPHILSLITFARVPLMVRVGESDILTLKEQRYKYLTRDSCCSFVVVGNAQSSNPVLLQSIRESLSQSFSNTRA